ncbi:hypothetical protein CTI12_AA623700 [Artemisia annua]|uniref:Uncharacterized protein n=1 Tax=Artemisia annua TaxID=35608 RepID=A0A2U1KB55_ARTAN|nr:hypothetical protein CTI12_AA623700 [Artemisia annua]
MKTNKAAALAKFLERKSQEPSGLSSINPKLVELAVKNAKETVRASNAKNSERRIQHVNSFGDSEGSSEEDEEIKVKPIKHKKKKMKKCPSEEDEEIKVKPIKHKKKKNKKNKKNKKQKFGFCLSYISFRLSTGELDIRWVLLFAAVFYHPDRLQHYDLELEDRVIENRGGLHVLKSLFTTKSNMTKVVNG